MHLDIFYFSIHEKHWNGKVGGSEHWQTTIAIATVNYLDKFFTTVVKNCTPTCQKYSELRMRREKRNRKKMPCNFCRSSNKMI